MAPADTPLNLLETPDGFLISTNSGYGAQYLQAYDERHNKIADRIDFPSLWYGLAYASGQKSILASTGATSVMVIPLHAGEFGEPREIVLDHCELTAGIAVQDDSTAVVACNRTYEVVRFNFLTGKILQRAKVGEFPYAVKVLPGGKIAVANWGQASVSILNGENLGSRADDSCGEPSLRYAGDSEPATFTRGMLGRRSCFHHRPRRTERGSPPENPNSQLRGHWRAAKRPGSRIPLTGKLFVALAAVNALAVVDLGAKEEEPKLEGIIPVGGYPTSLVYSAHAT